MKQADELAITIASNPAMQRAIRATVRQMLRPLLDQLEPGLGNTDPMDKLMTYPDAAAECGLSAKHIRNAVTLGMVEGHTERHLVNRRSLEDYIAERMPSSLFEMGDDPEKPRKKPQPQIKQAPDGSMSYYDAMARLSKDYWAIVSLVRKGRLTKVARGYVTIESVDVIVEKMKALET